MKYILLSVFVLLMGCSGDSDNFIEFEELGAITAVEIPAEVVVGQTTTFVVSFRVPSTCHSFQRLDFSATPQERIVAVVFAVTDNSCTPLSNFTEQVTFEITPDTPGTIVFKFFAGNNAQGEPTFIERVVDVTAPAG
ncbi:MAG: hypothetical protein RQ735_07580 [Flavobacteriaceae bacterium]|nr:hypothetical protein [Flavobacteriaceae bacterium]